MSDINAAWREKRRWRWIKPVRNMHVGPKLSQAPLEELQQDFSTEIEALRRRLRCEMAALKAEIKFRRLLRMFQKYNPSQPRDEIGRWTDGGGADSTGRNDPRILSDVTPDNDARPGAQYAQNRGRGSVSVRIGGQFVEVEGGQAARLVEAQSRAENATARVRELDPNWRPTKRIRECRRSNPLV